MSQPGSVVEVLLQSHGSQLVGNHSLSATTLLVDDPTPFDDAGGQVYVDGTAYTFTTVTEVADTTDPSTTNGQLALTSGLVAAEPDFTPVDMWNGDQVLDDLVLMVATSDEGDPPVPVTVTSDQRAFWEARLGLVDPPVAVVLSDDLGTLMDAPGWTPSINGAALDPTTIPDQVPTDIPPTVLTVTATGDSAGITAVATPDGIMAGSTLIKWEIDGVVVETTQSLVYRFTTDSVGAALVSGQAYSLTAQPTNDLGDGTLSAVAVGQLNSGVSAQTVLGWVAAGFLLAGTIQVGQMTLSPPTSDDPGGLRIPLTNGGQILFPADGSDAIITAILRARSLVVEDNLRIQGQVNAIEGGVQLANGTVAPSVKPRAGTSWDHAAAFTDTEADLMIGTVRSLYDNGASWYTTESAGGTGNVWSLNKTTGIRFLQLGSVADYQYIGGVTKVGTDWYVLCYRNSDSTWWVRKYNSSWVFQSQWQRAGAGVIPGNRITIASDGTFLYTSYRASGTGFIVVDRWNTNGTGATVVFTSSVNPASPVVGLFVGSADYGATRVVVATELGSIYVFNTSGAEQTTNRFARANGEQINGLAWDGTRFSTLAADGGKVYHHSVTAAAVSRSITYTWYDNDVGGTGTHETPASAALTYAQGARQWLRVDTDPPSFAGFPDDPNAVRIYIANQRQADLGTGVTTVIYDAPTTGGSAAPTSNGFAGVSAPGQLTSGASDGSGALTKFDGSGSYRLAGQDLDDAGWQAPTLGNSWVNFGSTWETAGYRKKNSWVSLRGLIKSGTVTSGTLIFTLPAGYRPSSDKHFVVACNSGPSAIINVLANGQVKTNIGVSNGFLSLAGVTFVAEQ